MTEICALRHCRINRKQFDSSKSRQPSAAAQPPPAPRGYASSAAGAFGGGGGAGEDGWRSRNNRGAASDAQHRQAQEGHWVTEGGRKVYVLPNGNKLKGPAAFKAYKQAKGETVAPSGRARGGGGGARNGGDDGYGGSGGGYGGGCGSKGAAGAGAKATGSSADFFSRMGRGGGGGGYQDAGGDDEDDWGH